MLEDLTFALFRHLEKLLYNLNPVITRKLPHRPTWEHGSKLILCHSSVREVVVEAFQHHYLRNSQSQ